MFRIRLGSFRPLIAVLPSLLIAACDMEGAGDDDDDGITPVGLADLRIAHVAPNAPNVDVFVDDAPAPSVMDLPFASGTDFFTLPAGTHSVAISATGTPSDTAVITLPDLSLAEDGIYTVAAFGQPMALDALVIEEDPAGEMAENVRVRVIHVAPEVGTVDLSQIVDGVAPTPLVANLAYGEISDALDIAAEPFVLGLNADDDATPDLMFEMPALEPGTHANVYAVSEMPGQVYLLVQTDPGEFARIMPVTPMPAPAPVP